MRRLALAFALLTGVLAAASTASAASMKPDFDVRQQATDPVAVAAPPAVARARDELRRSLGTQGIVSGDPADGMQTIARTDGFLSEPSAADNVDVARAYLADQRVALGLSADDLAGLRLVRTAPMGSGSSVFHFAQTVDGIPAYDAELAVAVDARGRVISVTGATQRDLTVPSTTPALSEAQAIEAARADAGVPSAGRDSSAKLTIFPADGRAVLAWRVLLMVDDVLYDDVIDATTGALLLRHGLVDQATNGWSFPGWPGNPVAGGTQALENFTPWLTSSTALEGDNAHVWPDTDADGTPAPSEEQAPNPSGDYDDPYTTFPNPTSGSTCDTGGCSWDSAVPYSWQANVKQNATQVFSYVNRFHDWLQAPPFDFTPANGNFEGDDPVNALTDYGADTDNGLPTSDYRNNANMGTPPDGESPTMRMYLFFGGGTLHDANGGDDAFVIYHEYTHGLSNRLVVDGQGVSTLAGAQARSMGEAWSDWYAFDFLVEHGYAIDDPSDPGSLPMSPVVGPVRTEPADCPVTRSWPAARGATGRRGPAATPTATSAR